MGAQSRVVALPSYGPLFIRKASENDIPAVKRIADLNKRYLGFTKRVILGESIAKAELHVAVLDRQIAGFIRWHRRRDGWTTVYELCVDEPYRGRGLGRMLIAVAGKGPVKLRCHHTNPALQFYYGLGFRFESFEITRGGFRMDLLSLGRGEW